MLYFIGLNKEYIDFLFLKAMHTYWFFVYLYGIDKYSKQNPSMISKEWKSLLIMCLWLGWGGLLTSAVLI